MNSRASCFLLGSLLLSTTSALAESAPPAAQPDVVPHTQPRQVILIIGDGDYAQGDDDWGPQSEDIFRFTDVKSGGNSYETVEASVQLRNLMKESSSSFEAIQKLEAPSFEQIFKNDELRREFENLTRKLDVPSS